MRYRERPWKALAWGDSAQGMGDIFREVLGFVRVMRRDQSGYAYLVQGRRDVRLTVLALDVAAHLEEVTGHLHGGGLLFRYLFRPSRT